MSEKNVEVARELYGVFERREIDVAFERLVDDAFELRLPAIYPVAETYRGREGVQDWLELLDDTWSEWRFEPEEFVPCGEKVLVFCRISGRGRASGAEGHMHVAHVWRFHGSRAAGVQVFIDPDEARQAAGLRE